ncbi:MAG TPA: oligosaccharide flippase family protein [Gammaproteobacteria bacterium]|nr:oligosaccharide flippase family protein [Gammaproteobacteria bacterium]
MPSFGPLARNTLWMILGQGVRILVQFAYFVLIARILHRDGYGAFAGAVALVAVLAPFAGWGSSNLLVKNVARDRDTFPRYWGRALIVSAVSGSLLTVLALSLAWLILPASVPLIMVLWVAIADLLFTRILEAACLAFQAVHRLFKTALLSIIYSLSRLAGVLVLLHMHGGDLLATWAILYLGATMLATVLAVAWVSLELGMPRFEMTGWHREFGEGFYFASSFSAQRIYMDSDKALLTRLGSLDAAGIYTAAARVVEVAFIPVFALLAAAYPRFFTSGQRGVQGTWDLSRKLLPYACVYALAAGIGLYLLAPLLPWLLGADFAESVSAVRWLSIVPLLMTLHRFAADSLTGAGWQAKRTHIEFGAAGLNVLLNVVLVPLFSWRGTASITVFTEVVLVIALWLVLYSISRGWGQEMGA